MSDGQGYAAPRPTHRQARPTLQVGHLERHPFEGLIPRLPRDRAACKYTRPGAPNPDIFTSRAPEDVAAAKRVCHTCPIASECLVSARPSDGGVWGGFTQAERRSM